MAATLRQLLASLPRAEVRDLASLGRQDEDDLRVEEIVFDSRRAGPGSLFVAYRGVETDGHEHAAAAVARGAVAAVVERELPGLGVPQVLVPNGREALAHLAAAWHGYPARRLTVVGVTGTDGKTTTCNLLHSILSAAGRRAGLVTTVNAVIGERVLDTGLHTTTPDAPDLQRFLAEMVDAGLEMAVLEVTSHGLEQHRVTACDFDVAAVTNVTHEHLDIHGSLEAYRRAKMMLFEHLVAGYRKPGVPKVAVLNADDDSYRYLAPIPADRHLAYSLGGRGDVVGTGVRRAPGAAQVTVQGPGSSFELRSRLAGDFNLYNVLAATTVALALGVEAEAIQEGVWRVEGVVGRMERIDEGQDFTAIVDFAHTSNALQRALEAARGMTDGRVIAVFGCAGERDREKRARMGEISGRLADVTVMTAEDPRRESLEAILDEMARGAEAAGAVEGRSYYRVPDRAEAIQFAVDLARPGDLVIACGKGHEQSMCFGREERPWNEHAVVRAALRRRLERGSGGI